uniref:Uncharacterized protein n=1 Tax=Plectus sambesii TaxID=2011161 RepID=A0A914XVP0_9BILA
MNAPRLGITSLAGTFVSDAGDDNGLESNRTRTGPAGSRANRVAGMLPSPRELLVAGTEDSGVCRRLPISRKSIRPDVVCPISDQNGGLDRFGRNKRRINDHDRGGRSGWPSATIACDATRFTCPYARSSKVPPFLSAMNARVRRGDRAD